MDKPSPGLLFSTRLTLSVVGFLGCMVMYTLRSDVSFAIVCMVNGTAVEDKTDDEKNNRCGGDDTSDDKDKVEGDLLWSNNQQGLALSSFFWGYLFSQIPGGYLAARFGARIVVGVCILSSSIVTLLCPVTANTHVYFFLAMRVLLGFFQGAVFPALQTLWSKWAPPLERSVLLSLCYAGAQMGVTITMPISAALCKYGFAGGWPSIYYVFGAFGIVWSVLWFFYASDSPEEHKFINPVEKKYIQVSLGQSASSPKQQPVPWKSVFASRAVWGLWGGHFASDWGAYMMMTSLPSYMNDVLNLDLNSMGVAAAVPYIAYFVFINIGGFVADKIRTAGWLSTAATRKLAMIVAMGSQAGFLIASGYCQCGQKALVIVFVTLGIGLSGFAYAGYVVNYLDIAGSMAGPIIGVGNTFTCLAGIAGPLIVGEITHSGTTGEWRLVFWITGVILLAGTLLYTFLARGELEPWAEVPSDETSTTSVEEKKNLDEVSAISLEEFFSKKL